VFVPYDEALVQVEGPTAYMPGNFSTFYTINVTTGALTPQPNQGSGPTYAPLV
jgi:hypothetical protein